MKRPLNLLLLLSVITCLYACTKDKQTAPNITGTWELRQTSGGFVGIQNYRPGNGHIYTFTANGSFTQYAGKDTLINQGTYSIKTSAIKVQGVLYNLLLLNGAQSGPEIQVQDTIMLLGLEYNNGVAGVYAKIK
jgi:hypothetical protein